MLVVNRYHLLFFTSPREHTAPNRASRGFFDFSLRCWFLPSPRNPPFPFFSLSLLSRKAGSSFFFGSFSARGFPMHIKSRVKGEAESGLSCRSSLQQERRPPAAIDSVRHQRRRTRNLSNFPGCHVITFILSLGQHSFVGVAGRPPGRILLVYNH